MNISSVHDAEMVLSEAKADVYLGRGCIVSNVFDALEWSIGRIKELEGKLTALRDAVDKAIGYCKPGKTYEILNDALQDSKE